MGFKRNDEICGNNLKTIQQNARRFRRSHWSFFGLGSEKKWYGTYTFKTWWILSQNCWANAAELLRIPSSGIPMYHRFGERTIKKHNKWKEVNKYISMASQKHWVASPNGHLRQSGLRSSSEYYWRFTSCSESSGEPAAFGFWTRWRFFYFFVFSQKCKPIKGDREICCKNTSKDLKYCQKTRSRNWTILLCSSVTKIRKKPIFVPRIYDASRSKRNSYQRVDPKQCTILHRLGQKSLHSLRKIQYWHSCSFFISMSNQILNSNNERFWQICQRSRADPSGRWSFGETRSKSETNAKTVIHKWLGLSSDWTEKMDGHWNAGIKWSLLFSSVEIHHSTTTTPPRSSTKKMMEQSMTMKVTHECQKKHFDNIGHWSDEMKKEFVNVPYWSIEKWILVLAKGGGQKKRCMNAELSSSILVLSSNSRTFRKYNQSCIARQCYCCQKVSWLYLSRRKRKRIEVNSEPRFDPRRNQSPNRKTSRIFHCCESDGRSEWLRRKPFGAICHKQESRHTEIFGNAFSEQSFGAIWSSLNKEECNPTKTRSNTVVFCDTLFAEFMGESDMHEDQGSVLSKGKRDSETACEFSKLIRNVIHKIHLYKKQDHLGNRNKCGELWRNPKQHCWLKNTRYIDPNSEIAGDTATK